MLNSQPVDAASPDLRSALFDAGLPIDDIQSSRPRLFQFLDGNRLVGYGGLELFGSCALLRSLVVLPEARGQGYGRAATRLLMQEAASAGARQVYLLTITSVKFFKSCGFNPVNRADAPLEILSTS